MSSSFRRKGGESGNSSNTAPNLSETKGWKPSVNNSLGMVSCGHKQLDDLLGGGLNLGTIMMINSDIHSNHADTLINYIIAESLSMGHATLLATSDIDIGGGDKLLGLLPFNRTLNSALSKDQSDELGCNDDVNDKSSATESQGQSQLKVAWQYAKYITASSKRTLPSLIPGTHYCCSYDLSKRLQGPIVKANAPQLYCAPHNDGDHGNALQVALNDYFDNIIRFITSSEANDGGSGGIFRVFLHRFDRILALHGETASNLEIESATSRFFTRLRVAIRCKRVVVVVSACPKALPACLLPRSRTMESEYRYNKLVNWAHSSIAVETFAGKVDQIPSEFSRFCAYLEVVSIQHLGTVVPRRPEGTRFGLLRDRRKLHVEPLHLPPEESRAQGSSGTDGRLEAKAQKLFGRLAEKELPQATSHEGEQPRLGVGKSLSYEVAPSDPPVPARSDDSPAASVEDDPSSVVLPRSNHFSAGIQQDSLRQTGRNFKRLNLNAPMPVYVPGEPPRGVNISSLSSRKAAEQKKISGTGTGLDF